MKLFTRTGSCSLASNISLREAGIPFDLVKVSRHDGKTSEGLKVTTSDLEILLLLDANHRLMRLEVPDAKVSVIRD